VPLNRTAEVDERISRELHHLAQHFAADRAT